jgi:hypothetical protein
LTTMFAHRWMFDHGAFDHGMMFDHLSRPQDSTDGTTLADCNTCCDAATRAAVLQHVLR